MSHYFNSTPIAIVGMACRLPGAGNLEEYWDMLKSGRSAVSELPTDRLNRELYYDSTVGTIGKTYSTLGGLTPDIPVDPERLGIPPKVSAATDIAHLTICEVAAEALHHAGMDPLKLINRNAGVYIGATGGSPWAGNIVFSTLIEETAAYLRELPFFHSSQSGRTGKRLLESVMSEIVREVRRRYRHHGLRFGPYLAAHVAAGIISYTFGLNGPFMAIDAACASSLQAMMLGVHALQQERVEMAIVGGASYCKSDSIVLFSQAQSVSSHGSCPFDADADGLVPSEGYVAMVLKTLPRALIDGDPVCAVIRRLGMSTDGRGKSLWAPLKRGQVVAIQHAYAHGLDMSQVQYIEAHATSTQVGDATELTALAEAVAGKLLPGQRIALGSSKGNIGHTLETAGIAGLAKVVLAIQHEVIPPSINIRKLNPKIDWDTVPFFVPQEPLPWDENEGGPRRAAVNAFGIGGLNVHVVLDEFVREQPKGIYFSPSELTTARESAEPIAVIGTGAIYPGAHTIDQFWELLISGKNPKSEVPRNRWNKDLACRPGRVRKWKTFNCIGGFIRDYEYDWRTNKIPPKQIAHANPLQFMLLDAAAQALREAGYDKRPFDRTKVGVIVGNVFGGDFQSQLQMGLRLPEFNSILVPILRKKGLTEDQINAVVDQYREIFFRRMPALLDETGSFTSSTLASRITKKFDLLGGALALDAGSGSGLAAISSAVDILRSGDCDMMICAAGQRSMDLTTFENQARSGTLADGEPLPAFDAGTDGVVPGEGVGVVLLKRLADAQRDGDPIKAVLRGIGVCTHIRKPARAYQSAMLNALREAESSPARIRAIETGGGLPKAEAAELEAAAAVLKESPPAQPVLLGSVVSQIGYCGAASSMASFLKATMMLESKSVPVGTEVENPLPAVAGPDTVFALPRSPVPLKTRDAEETCLIGVTSGVTDGQSYFAVLDHGGEKRAVPSAAVAAYTTTVSDSVKLKRRASAHRIICIGSPSRPALKRRLFGMMRDVSRAFYSNTDFEKDDMERVAIVAASAEQLSSQLQLALDHLDQSVNETHLESKSVFVRRVSENLPRVAWMFAGQGSQYGGMLWALVNEFPAAEAAMKRVDEALVHFGCGSFADLAWHNTAGLSENVWQSQITVLTADYILAESLKSLSVRPDIVAGHSFGEYAALISAGVWPLKTAIDCSRLRADVLRRTESVPGRMIAISAPLDVVHRIMAVAGGTIYIANYNAPGQIVLSGRKEDIVRVADVAKRSGVAAVMLRVPCAFHTPMLADAAHEFAGGLRDIPFSSARVPLLSTVSNRYMIEEDDIRLSLRDQLTHPVRYEDMVRKIARDHQTVFVEIGPQRVLSRLHQKILAGQPISVVATDDARRPGLEQLLCVVAILKSCGIMVEEKFDGQANAIATAPVEEGKIRQTKLVHFDATSHRRQSRRLQAAENARTFAVEADTALGQALPPAEEYASGKNALLPATVTISDPDQQREQLESLRKFMIDFIVEQTGYPEEMVDLDADLEADLGIDSIKKAQLFGEIQENFQITPPTENVTLDDFPTLKHVLDFLKSAGIGEPVQARESGVDAEPPGISVERTMAVSGTARITTSNEAERLMSRFVLRMVPEPLDDRLSRIPWGKRMLIVGDNPDATSVRDRLQRRGLEVLQLKAQADSVAAVKAVDRLWKDGPISHLFLMTPRDQAPMPYANEHAWNERRSSGILFPYALCQKWFELAMASELSLQPMLVAVTSLGGDLGFGGDFSSPEGGDLAGLVKAVGAEAQGRVRVKVIDFPSHYAPEHLASEVIAEVSADTREVEVGYDSSRNRKVVRARIQPASSLTSRSVRPGSTWVVTGGARGVTAFVARELGRRFRLKLHLLGTSPVPQIDSSWRQLSPEELKQLKARTAKEARQRGESPADAWNNIERAIEMDRTLNLFADQGVEAHYHQCNISDRARLAEVFAAIRRKDGSVEGVIHGAGVENACKFPSKRLNLVSRAIAAKVDGAAALMELLNDNPPKFFVGFGSTSGRFGGVGQTDYSLANDMLCKLVSQFRRRHPGCAAVCLDWTAWGEVGMAARPESRFALQAMNVQFMSPGEGVDHVIDELQSIGADPEVLIIDPSGTLLSDHLVMSGVGTPLHAPASISSASASAHSIAEEGVYRAGYQYGQEHRIEILSYLREYADQFSHSDVERTMPSVPESMRRIMETESETELRGVASGVDVALVSLLAHNNAVRDRFVGGRDNDLRMSRGLQDDRSVSKAVPSKPVAIDVSNFPLLEKELMIHGDEKMVVSVLLSPQTDVFLREHRMYGRPVLPGAVSAEILSEAASLLNPARSLIGISNLDMVSRYDFASDTNVHADVIVHCQNGDAACQLVVSSGRKQGDPTVILATAHAIFADQPLTSETLAIGAPTYSWQPFVYPDDWPVLYHGPSLRTLLELAFQHDGGRARLIAPPQLQLAGSRSGHLWLIPSALLDGCMVACGAYSYFMIGRRVEIPRRIGELLLYRHPRENERCLLRLFIRSHDSQGTHYDFHLVGEDGLAIMTVKDYTTICIEGGEA